MPAPSDAMAGSAPSLFGSRNELRPLSFAQREGATCGKETQAARNPQDRLCKRIVTISLELTEGRAAERPILSVVGVKDSPTEPICEGEVK